MRKKIISLIAVCALMTTVIQGNVFSEETGKSAGDVQIMEENDEGFELGGRVLDEHNRSAENVELSLYDESGTAAGMTTVTDGSGRFMFESVKKGKYTIKVIYGEETKHDLEIEVELVGDDRSIVINLPPSGSRIDLEVEGDDTPDFEVNGLNDIASRIADESGELITLTMKIKKEKEDKSNEIHNKIRETSDNEYVDIFSSELYWEEESVDDGYEYIEMKAEFDTSEKHDIKVYTVNEGVVNELGKDAGEGEYYTVSGNTVKIVTNHFEIFAIGYNTGTEQTMTPSPAATASTEVRRSGGGGSSVRTGATASPSPQPTVIPTEEPDTTDEPSEPALRAPSPMPSSGDEWWFIDVPKNEWFYPPIRYAYDMDLMVGVNADEFYPDFPLTRAMMVTIIHRIEGSPKNDTPYPYKDVPDNLYFNEPLRWGTETRVVEGYSDDAYGPYDFITREQLAAMLWRYMKYRGLDVSKGDDMRLDEFSDAEDVTHYAIPALQWACGMGIMVGFEDGSLRPKANTTRAQTATLLRQIGEMYGEDIFLKN